jgi:hypothetical protein
MDQKQLFFFHLLLGEEDLAIELFDIRIPSLAPLFVFSPIFARRPPNTKSRANATTGFFGCFVFGKTRHVEEKLSEVAIVDVVSTKRDFENACLLPSFLPSFFPFVDDRRSTYLAKLENKDTLVSTANHTI